jgi:transcriptional regulator with XRE-family HTH domain
MLTNGRSFKTAEYWMDVIQDELRHQVKRYMDEKGISQAQLARELGVAKGYIVQVLKGKFNYSLSKLIDLSVAVGAAPIIEFKSLNEYLLQDEKKKPKRGINLSGNKFLDIKDSKKRVSLHPNENGSIVSLDVYQASTLTPADIKIA